jgi:hypothetical protein
MTLYTVMPLEVIWEGCFKEPEKTIEIAIGSNLIQVMPVDHESVQIIRLLNCPLDFYLNPVYAPGQIIKYIPFLQNGPSER